MDLQQKLKEQGWHVTTEGLNKLPPEVDKCDTRKVVQSLLDIDLRDVGAGALPVEISRKEESIAGRIVLQIMKIRNIAAPKSNEESKVAPRFLYLELTDGVTQVFALEIENISSISLNTPPGTKLYLRSERISLMQCILMLRPSDVQVLGGEVVALVEKWELSRTLQKYARGGRVNTGSSGPPPWIPFGQKIQQFTDDKNFKSLAAGTAPEKEKDAKDNEFDVMRNEAIAEAAKSGAKKVFGGGNQQMMDHNVKKIMEKGFSEMEAKNALKTTRNNLERALYNLKRRDEARESSETKEVVRGTSKMRPFEKSKKSIGKEEQVVAPFHTVKPSGNVSLFDFLTDKLPANTETTTSTTTSSTTTTSTATATTNTSSTTTKYERHTSRYDSSRSQNSSSNQQHQHEYGGNSYQSQNSIPNDQQSSSNSQQQQANASKGMKFENNISSSFANRNSNNAGDGGDGNNYRNRGRNERGERSSRGGGAGGGGGGGPMSYSTRHQGDMGRSGVANYNYNSNQGYNNSNRNQTRPSQERERGPNAQQQQQQQPTYGDNRMNGQRMGNDNRSYKTSSSARYPTKPNQPNYPNQNPSNSNRNYSDNRNSYQSDSNKIKELIEDTAKMKIDHRPSNRGGASNRGQRSHSNVQQQMQSHQKPMQQHQSSVTLQHQPQPQQQSQQQQQQQHVQVTQQPQMQHPSQQSQPHAVYTQLPNGFAYDPTKIRGFQNKESNEYALSMLKNQTLPPPTAAIPPPPQNALPQYPQPPPPMPMPPQQQVFPGPPPFIMQPPQHVRAFGIPTMEGTVFNWRIGDRCLAKYWDDGRFYEAEITGLSDKTCVVLFMGYGNYEEVLKSDCLPINTNAAIMSHQPAAIPPQPQPMQQAVHAAVHSQTNTRTAPANAASSSSSRYRGERQMYVPPPKREA